MRILLLTNYHLGLYKFRRELLAALVARGDEVYASLPDEGFANEIKALGCKLIDTRISRHGLNPVLDIALFLRYAGMLRKLRPDAVLTYTIKPNVYGGLACRLLGFPYIANVTGLGNAILNGGLLGRLSMMLYGIGLKGAKCVFFQNRVNRDFMEARGVVASHSRLLPGSGVNLEHFKVADYPDDGNGIRFLFIGRLTREKGLGELLEAMEMLRGKGLKASLSIVGFQDEQDFGQLDKAVESGVAEYLGEQKDVRPFIAASHCTVLPSYHEGMANVLLESAAMGRPVISTRVPGCMETYDEGSSGLGCDVRSAESLAGAMETFMGMSWEQRRQMGLKGRDKMETQFSRQSVVDAYLQELEGLG